MHSLYLMLTTTQKKNKNLEHFVCCWATSLFNLFDNQLCAPEFFAFAQIVIALSIVPDYYSLLLVLFLGGIQ